MFFKKLLTDSIFQVPSYYDSSLCWLVWQLMLSYCSKDTRHSGVETRIFPPLFSRQSSHLGEQHCATGRASWGGSGCAEEHLWYGLPQGGQARTCTSQWHVRPSRLLQQYVSTSSSCSSQPGHSANAVHTLFQVRTTLHCILYSLIHKQPAPKVEQVYLCENFDVKVDL